MSLMHFEIGSIDDRHDRLLRRIKTRTRMLIDMVTKSVKINEDV